MRPLDSRSLALAAAAGVGLGVLYTLSPLLVLWAAGTTAFLLRAGRDVPAPERHWLRGLLATALALRVIAVLALVLATGADSQSMGILLGDEGYLLRRALRLRNVWLGFAGAPYDYINAFEDYAWTGYLYVVAYLQVLLGPSPYSLRLVNDTIFVAACSLLYRLARRAYGPAPALLGLSILVFLPTQFAWSISLLKESAYLLLTAATLVSAVAALRAETLPRRRVWAAAGALAAVALIWPLRPQGVAMTLVGLGAGVLLWWATKNVRRALATAIIVPIAAGALLQQPRVQAATLDLVQRAAREHGGHVFTVGHAYRTLDKEFYTDPTFFTWTLTPAEAGRFIVRSAVAFVIIPLPWQLVSISELLFLPEQIVWYLLVVLAVTGVRPCFRRDPLTTSLLLGFLVVASAAVALTSGNVGTLIRHRSLSIPFMVWISAAGAIWLIQWAAAPTARSAAPVPDASRTSEGRVSDRREPRASGASARQPVMSIAGSSRVVARVGPIVRGSLILWPFQRFASEIGAVWRALGRVEAGRQPRGGRPPAHSLDHLVDDSVLMRILMQTVATVSDAVESSATIATVRSAMTAVAVTPAAQMVRRLGITAIAATLTHMVLLQAVPERLRPAMPWYVGLVVGLLAVILIAAPEPVARAWTTWRRR